MPPPNRLTLDRLPSPLGDILLVTDETGAVRALDFNDYAPRMTRLLRLHYGEQPLDERPAPASIRADLTAYFEGEPRALAATPWATGGTAFQRQVWTALTTISPGQTSTYAALAAQIGRPTSVRAVGAANGANPVAILVPCHRLIGAVGGLTGYAGGLERKAWLLRHEGAIA